jgi:hypothetical protein
MKHKYNTINTKIQKLKNEQKNKTHKTNNNFYKRIEYLSNITFTDETQLIQNVTNKLQILTNKEIIEKEKRPAH